MHCEADERSTTEYDSGSGKGRGARRALTNGEGTLLQPEMIPIIQPLAPDSTGSDIIGINQCVLYAGPPGAPQKSPRRPPQDAPEPRKKAPRGLPGDAEPPTKLHPL